MHSEVFENHMNNTHLEANRSVQYNEIEGRQTALSCFKGKVQHFLFVRTEPFADPIYHPTFQCVVSNAF
jgi:hypothetical protein